jgi:hypothetical protein
MVDDPIVEEIRQARQQHATKFNFDLQAAVGELLLSRHENDVIHAKQPKQNKTKQQVLKPNLEPVLV